MDKLILMLEKYDGKNLFFDVFKCILIFIACVILGIGNTCFKYTHHIVYWSFLLMIGALLISLIKRYKSNIISKSQILLVMLTILFIVAYWKNGIRLNPSDYWWRNLITAASLALLVGFITNHKIELLISVVSFCLGAWSLVFLYIIIDIINGQNPYWGGVFDPVDNIWVNSSGLSNITILLPTVLIPIFVFLKPQKYFILFVATLSLFSCLILGYICKSRTVLLILLFILPGILFLEKYFIRTKIKKPVIIIIMLVSGYFILTLWLQLFFPRPLEMNLTSDPRMLLLKSFGEQLLSDPLKQAIVPLDIGASSCSGVWFHNFFADVHRSSGFVAFLLSILLTAFIGCRLILAALRSTEGIVLLPLFFCNLCILMTSVVPEGEFQPLLLLILIGSVTEALLKGNSNVSVS